MASSGTTKICEADGGACKKEIRAFCFHCSKNLCRAHLMQHTQLMEESTSAELNILADKFNELISRFEQVPTSMDILTESFRQIEKWRAKAHQRIDEIADKKHQELIEECQKHQKALLAKKEEELMKIKTSKILIAELIQEADASAKQIADLQKSIAFAEQYLKTNNQPTIGVIADPVSCSVDICVGSRNNHIIDDTEIRLFQVHYVRLNGSIKNYDVQTGIDTTMKHLIQNFIEQYDTIENSTKAYANEHMPKFDYILPVDVYDHRVHQQFTDTTAISSIPNYVQLVFYETPFSVSYPSNSRIRMPCSFRRVNSNRIGWPIYLNVPRRGCRTQDVRDALQQSLDIFLPSGNFRQRPSYGLYLETIANHVLTTIKFSEIVHNQLDFNRAQVSLVVDMEYKTID
ncbi:unnamed protein product [Adineta ricciae]|uniref:Uncharacterized protein n=1 Tax=Adineta ricciae TaxID=249248 RepID=A0A815I299_ADIRI|nr:unnamed protein product [Adineta ricciae]CAF1390679.1 unnamed protein product [Adineta ricciae]